ncbi:MAG: hypothetical protein RIB70_07985 [Roseitalea porphyridii]|uniref:hypothetical protein n=1 Tax=Roseitalea porphyridii TaxID=1852022 RepID=UPI0032ECF724
MIVPQRLKTLGALALALIWVSACEFESQENIFSVDDGYARVNLSDMEFPESLAARSDELSAFGRSYILVEINESAIPFWFADNLSDLGAATARSVEENINLKTGSFQEVVSVNLADGHEVWVFVWFDGRYNYYVTDRFNTTDDQVVFYVGGRNNAGESADIASVPELMERIEEMRSDSEGVVLYRVADAAVISRLQELFQAI